MSHLLKRLRDIKSPADVDIVSQIYLQSLGSGLTGFSWTDIENIGRTADILMTYATKVYPNELLTKTLVSGLTTVLESVMSSLSSEDKIRLVSLFPSNVGLCLAKLFDTDQHLFLHMMSQAMVDGGKGSVIDKIMT